MSDSASSAAGAAAGAAAGWKLIGGAAGAAGIGAGLAAIVVMLMMQPRSPKEWAVGLITTVIGSVAGGAAVVQHYQLQAWMDSYAGIVALIGVVFACGLPSWAVVRWTFTFIERRRDKDLADLAAEMRKHLRDAP